MFFFFLQFNVRARTPYTLFNFSLFISVHRTNLNFLYQFDRDYVLRPNMKVPSEFEWCPKCRIKSGQIGYLIHIYKYSILIFCLLVKINIYREYWIHKLYIFILFSIMFHLYEIFFSEIYFIESMGYSYQTIHTEQKSEIGSQEKYISRYIKVLFAAI